MGVKYLVCSNCEKSLNLIEFNSIKIYITLKVIYVHLIVKPCILILIVRNIILAGILSLLGKN